MARMLACPAPTGKPRLGSRPMLVSGPRTVDAVGMDRRAGLGVSTTVGVALAVTVLAPSGAQASPYVHREPLPTVEVVPTPRRARIIDVRGPVQFGWGWSTLLDAPVYSMSFEASVSFFEITKTTWLHFTLGESAMVSALRRQGEESPGLFGVDAGLGLSRYASRGPAFLITGTIGPRWSRGGPERLRPDGFGVQAKAEVFPFYASIPELVEDDRGWFRRYVLSGTNLWVSGRYDQVQGQTGYAWSGGVGLDLGRSVILPTLMAVDRRRQRHR